MSQRLHISNIFRKKIKSEFISSFQNRGDNQNSEMKSEKYIPIISSKKFNKKTFLKNLSLNINNKSNNKSKNVTRSQMVSSLLNSTIENNYSMILKDKDMEKNQIIPYNQLFKVKKYNIIIPIKLKKNIKENFRYKNVDDNNKNKNFIKVPFIFNVKKQINFEKPKSKLNSKENSIVRTRNKNNNNKRLYASLGLFAIKNTFIYNHVKDQLFQTKCLRNTINNSISVSNEKSERKSKKLPSIFTLRKKIAISRSKRSKLNLSNINNNSSFLNDILIKNTKNDMKVKKMKNQCIQVNF